jgi:type I restriction enzyme, S subunit
VEKDAKSAVVPRLRFPEFREVVGWDVAPMGSSIGLEYGASLPEHARRPGVVPVMGSNGVVGYHDEALVKGPAIVVGRKGSVGQVNWVESDCFPIDTTYYVEIRQPSSTSMQFLYRLLQISKLDQRSDSSAVPGLNRSAVHSLEVAIPGPAEQQKIVDCLTSLDEVIAAQGRKVEALKAHKDGLVQQLLPREGEIVPRLRLAGSIGKGVWHTQKISALLSKVSDQVSVSPAESYREVGIRSHGKGIFHKEPVSGKMIGQKRVFHVVNDALILNIVFAWEQAVATTSKSEVGMIASHRFPMYVAKPAKCDVRYVKEFLLTNVGKHLLGVASPGGAGRNKTLGQREFENLEIALPTSVREQTQIANCLSSLDAGIAAEITKLDTLKTHKKGLLQQLFPSSESL